MFSKKITILVSLVFATITLIAQTAVSEATVQATETLETAANNHIINDELPELQNFSAELKDKNVYVDWQMNHTEEIIGFELYKSTDGSDWEMIEFLACDETLDNEFTYIDETPNWGFNYYRIKSVDVNGQVNLLRTAKIVYHYETGADVGEFFPNPANQGTARLSINVPNGEEAQIYIHDSMGRLVNQFQQTIADGTDTINLDLNDLSQGIYYTTIRINRESYSRKIMVNAVQ